MIDIFKFYIETINKIFNQVLNGFEITNGLGFGTFLLGCGIFVVFVNVLKFQLSTNGLENIKSYRNSFENRSVIVNNSNTRTSKVLRFKVKKR